MEEDVFLKQKRKEALDRIRKRALRIIIEKDKDLKEEALKNITKVKGEGFIILKEGKDFMTEFFTLRIKKNLTK